MDDTIRRTRAEAYPPCLQAQVYSYQRFAAERPLGAVDIPLGSLSKQGEERDKWYPLEPFGKLKAGGRLGSIRIKLRIGPVVDSRDASSRIFEDMKRGLDDRGDEEPGYEEEPPNFLKITLHEVRSALRFHDGNGVCWEG